MKDLIYWLIIVVLFSLLSSDIGQYNDLLLDNWAFAGTIVSIILAVIAILYTFDQSSTTVASTKKLEESANRVEEATKELEGTNINDTINELEQRLSLLIGEIQHSITENVSTNIEGLKTLFGESGSRNTLDKSVQILDEIGLKRYLETKLNIMTSEGFVLLFAYKLQKNNKKYSTELIRKFFRKLYPHDLDNEIEYFVGLFHGQLKMYKALNLLDYEFVDNQADISIISDTVLNEIEIFISDPSFEKDEEEYEEYQVMKEIITHAKK